MLSQKVLCCIPARIGVILMSTIMFLVYIAIIVLSFIKRDEMELWATTKQSTDTDFTKEAFNGLFYAFVSVFIVYAVVLAYGILSAFMDNHKLVRIYHILNWFFVLLVLTSTLAYWIYFKVKQTVYVNDCQEYENTKNQTTDNTYSPVAIPGKTTVAGGADKSFCIDLVNKLVIGTGVVVFVGNFIQVYIASSIGIYSTSLKRNNQHQRLHSLDDDEPEKS
ncbi:hypothetical protein J3Q64DRAFT_1759305 [Phycomyces blakesleeanus]|uniref:MARVEL domain-containing protein n=1 Tax=Phycomyces blakesleeanus TaxID=4837 RepID=A0ABR3AS54_PHYBL